MAIEWKGFLTKFENQVMLPMYKADSLTITPEPVPFKRGKLHVTDFGAFLGDHFQSEIILSFNYYGLYKPSSELIKCGPMTYGTTGSNTVMAPVINFSSVKLDHIELFSKDLLLDFVSFKRYLVYLRWNK